MITADKSNTSANAQSISQSRVQINGLTYGQALNDLEQYLWRDEYYLPYHKLPEVLKSKGYDHDIEAVQEYMNQISSDAFFDILGLDVEYPSDYALGGTGNDSIWTVTAEAFRVIFGRVEDALDINININIEKK